MAESVSARPRSPHSAESVMHELSIAMSILEGVDEEVSRSRYGTVNAIHIRVGVLSGVMPAALLSAFEMAREGTPFAQCTLRIEDAPALIRCSHCGQDSV